LSAADRSHCIDGFDTRLERLFDRLSLGDAGSLPFNRPRLRGHHGAFSVERIAERIDHAAKERRANGHREQLAGGTNLVALCDLEVVPQNHNADTAFFEVECEAYGAVGEFNHLPGHHCRQARAARDAVADLDHSTHFRRLYQTAKVFNLLLDD